MTDKVAVVFGGTGFIGSYLADLLLRDRGFSKVFLVDLQTIEEKPFAFRKELVRRHGTAIQYIRADVRSPIGWFPEEKVHLVANFAAVHREPGHEDFEYFETNLSGARHVCAWAEKVGCAEVIFTSSISPYGVSEAEKDEGTMTVPVTAYGSSKLAAEEIHRTWQAADPLGRVLTIVRPGVVFGAGEGGNVSRLVRAVSSGYFLYMGNRGTRKAGIYVKELCEAMLWVLDRQRTTSTPVALFNASMNPGPSISEYVDAVVRVSGRRAVVPNVPYRLLLAVSHVIDAVAKPLRIAHPFSPVRVRKLVRSNNVLPRYLSENGYVYRYTLDSAMQDWRSECPAEWR